MVDAPRRIEWYGVNDSVWHLHGLGMGAEGIIMTGVKGMYHPLRVPRDQRPAFMPGGIPGIPKTDPQVMDLKIFSTAPTPAIWEDVENRWWAALSDESDGTLRVYNRASTSYRECDWRVQTWPEDDMDVEPEEDWPWAIPMIAYRPGWRGQTITSSWSGSGTGTLQFVNPGDMDIPVQISLTNTGVEKWTVPDGIAGDSIPLEVFSAGVGDLFVDTDPFAMQLDSDTESQIAMSLLGLRFRKMIPANTLTPVEVPIRCQTAAGAPTAGIAKAYMTPMWRRPW